MLMGVLLKNRYHCQCKRSTANIMYVIAGIIKFSRKTVPFYDGEYPVMYWNQWRIVFTGISAVPDKCFTVTEWFCQLIMQMISKCEIVERIFDSVSRKFVANDWNVDFRLRIIQGTRIIDYGTQFVFSLFE